MIKSKKIICFDMDGTLINSFSAHAKAFNKSFEFNNLEKKPEASIKELIGLRADKMIKKLFPEISSRKIKTCIEKYHDFLKEDTYKHAMPIDGAMKTLKILKKDWKLALVSGTQKSEIQLLLKQGGIDQNIFDVIIGGDEVKHEKPSPDEIKKAEKIIENKVEWMVGDTKWDIQSGKAAKVKTVAVLTGKTSLEELVREDPTMIIQSVYMLPKAFKE